MNANENPGQGIIRLSIKNTSGNPAAAVILSLRHQVAVLPGRALLCLWNVRGTAGWSRTRINLLRTQMNL